MPPVTSLTLENKFTQAQFCHSVVILFSSENHLLTLPITHILELYLLSDYLHFSLVICFYVIRTNKQNTGYLPITLK